MIIFKHIYSLIIEIVNMIRSNQTLKILCITATSYQWSDNVVLDFIIIGNIIVSIDNFTIYCISHDDTSFSRKQIMLF